MLTIINDPTGATGWRQFEWDYSLTIQQNIETHLDSGEGCAVRLNGLPIDPAIDPVMEARPRTSDEVMIAKRPEGFDPFTWMMIAWAAATVVMYSMMPKINPNSANIKESPNNRLTGQTNTARAYQGIPDVYGSRRVWPDLIQPSVVEYIGHVKYVTELMCISRGEGVVSEVRYSDSDLVAGADGASFEVFDPQVGGGYAETRQTVVPGVIEAFAVPDVDGQEIPPAAAFQQIEFTNPSVNYGAANLIITAPYQSLVDQMITIQNITPGQSFTVSTSDGTVNMDEGVPVDYLVNYTHSIPLQSITVSGGNVTMVFASNPFGTAMQPAIWARIRFDGGVPSSIIGPFVTPTEADLLRWNVVFLRGLKGSAQIRTTLWKVDGDGNTIAGTQQVVDRTYSADTFDARYFTEDFWPAAGHGLYRVQFVRINQENGDGTDAAKLETLAALRWYSTKTFPGVTLIRVTTKATEAATSFRERKINVRWFRKVRSFFDSDTYYVEPSSNFARIIFHLWTTAGRNVEELDISALRAINLELGEASQLLSFNGSLDDADMALGERVRLIADHARCLVWRNGTKWTFARDDSRPYPVMQLDYLNMAPSEPSMSYSAHLPSTHDGVELEYVDPATQARKVYVRLNISSGAPVVGTSANPMRIRMPGCTNSGQAENRARLEARRLIYQRQSLKVQALSDAMDLGPGSLIRWVDPDDFYADDKLQAGEVLSIAGNAIQTSEPLRWDGQTQGRILFTDVNGRYIGSPVVCTPADGGAQLASIPVGLFTAGGVRQLGSRYTFAVGLTDAELESASLWTVTGTTPNADGTVSVACVNYDRRIYEAD